jgi:hypothetical protein
MFQTLLARNMEDLFFFEKEKKLAEARKKLELMQETKENLSKVSGITDDDVLQKLIDLDIRPDILTTLLMIPLVEIAWADGELHENERELLVKSLNKSGMHTRQVDPEILQAWIKNKPSPELFSAWELYIQALCGQLTLNERQTLKADVMADAHSIAEAAGGFLGFAKISDAEQAMLDKLEAAFTVACEA